MSFDSIRMSDSMINATVNAVFESLGTNSIEASKALQKTGIDENYDGKVDKAELKNALKYDRVSLSFKEAKTGDFSNDIHRKWNSMDLVNDVVNRMDASDGRKDGNITIKNDWGQEQTWSASFVKTSLTSGTAVVGNEIRDRASAKALNFTLAEIHQNKNGPKIVMGQ